jgi:CRP/FNR family transcriptional regulator, cyclic AMP receptor protein
MNNTTDLSLIKTAPLFKGLSDTQLLNILQLAFIKEYAAGIVLFHEGSCGDVMYVVISGSVDIVKKGAEKETIIARVCAGEFFGEMALLENDTRTAAARVAEYSKILVITRRAFEHMIQGDAQAVVKLLMEFLKSLSNRFRNQ